MHPSVVLADLIVNSQLPFPVFLCCAGNRVSGLRSGSQRQGGE